MTWLIFILGAAMAAAGLLSIVSGYPYTRVEWGWTEVIAGATVFSGGALIVAIGVVLLRLESLRRALERGSVFAAPLPVQALERSVPPVDDVAPGPGMTPDAGMDPGGAAEPVREAAVDETPHHLPHEPLYEPAPVEASVVQSRIEPQPDAYGQAGAGDIESPPHADGAPARPVDAPRPPRSSMLASFRERMGRAKEPPPPPQTVLPEPITGYAADEPRAEPLPPHDPAAHHAVALTEGVPPTTSPGEAHGETGGGPPDWADIRSPTAPHLSETIAPEIVAPSPNQRHREEATAPGPAAVTDDGIYDHGHPATVVEPEAATVVGRYNAGGASYVLFSDGTIEVETETGIHRFASMRELKAFIEQTE